MAWVLRKKGGEAITIDREVSIGRDPSCTIRIQAPAVSRIHCRLRPANDYVILMDEGRNGTLVNGIRVGKVAHINAGDVIEVDTEHFQVQRTIPASVLEKETQDLGYIPEEEVTHKKPSRAPPPPGGGPAPSRAPSPSYQGSGAGPARPSQAPGYIAPPTMVPPPMAPPPQPPPHGGGRRADEGTAPTTEVSIARMRGEQNSSSGQAGQEQQVPFEVEVVEDVGASTTRYRDAVRLLDEQALLVMTDFAGNPVLSPSVIAGWKAIVRKAGAKGKGPDDVLRILNAELFEAKLQATATCARLMLRERLIAVACAGTSPPFVVRGGNRVARVQAAPTVTLGRVRAAQFTERTLHFDRGDAFLLPSVAFFPPLETLLGQPFDLHNMRVAEWLRQHRVQPPGGSLLCLTVR